jgi:hypothetical protein
MPNHTHHLVSICARCYAPHKPCNFFVKDVAGIMNVPLPSSGTADELIDQAAAHWRSLNSEEAANAANLGMLVIAGMKSSELREVRGHVAVVLPGKLHGFPRVAATNEGNNHWGKSQGNTPLTEVFPAAAVRANRVRYFAQPAGASGSW